MKVYKPGTDCAVDFTIFADGKKCPEFVLPDAEDEGTASVCFIPVADDARITVQGSFTGSVLYGRVDVLADGAFVANRIIEDPISKEGRLKFWDSRKIEVKTFLHVPDVDDRKPRKRPNIVEGNMIAKRLPSHELAGPLNGDDDDAAGIGVGSIALIISMNQEASDVYGPKDEDFYQNVSLGSRRNGIADVVDSGIKPEQEMTMDVFADSNPIKDKKATLFWRDAKAQRPGSEPWVYMVFYYRTQAAINAAGCVPLTGIKALPPDDGTFTRAGDQVFEPPKVLEPPPVLSPPVHTPEPTASSPPEPESKRTLGLGQALLLPGTHNDSDENCLSVTADEGSLNKSSDRQRKASSKTNNAQASMRPAPTSKSNADTPAPESLKPRVSFNEPLNISSGRKDVSASNTMARADDGGKVDDLAAPSLPAFTPRARPARPAASPSTMSTFGSSPKSLEDISPASKTQPRKRTASQTTPSRTNAPASSSASPSASDSATPSNPKRLRIEEMQRKKAQMLADIQAKKERTAANKKKFEEEKRHHEEQQRLWAEEETKRREEEEKRRAAEEEEDARRAEEAMMAEMEALERENELADEEMARLAEEEESERMEWEGIVRARGRGGM